MIEARRSPGTASTAAVSTALAGAPPPAKASTTAPATLREPELRSPEHRPAPKNQGLHRASFALTATGFVSTVGVMMATLNAGLSQNPEASLPVLMLSMFGALGTLGAGVGLEHVAQKQDEARKDVTEP